MPGDLFLLRGWSGLSESHLKCLNLDGDQLRAHIQCIKEIEGLEAKFKLPSESLRHFQSTQILSSAYIPEILGRADRAALDW